MSNVVDEQSESGKSTVITIDLMKKGGVERAISMLERRKAKLQRQSEMFVNRLANIGISVAKKNTGQFKGYIEFSKDIVGYEGGTLCFLVARDKEKIERYWYYRGDPQGGHATISPLLMAEFGSGWLAKVLFPMDEGSVGQGTFPDQKHANDEEGWYWTDENGYHRSKGEQPTHPMYAAAMAMLAEIQSVAKGVFM